MTQAYTAVALLPAMISLGAVVLSWVILLKARRAFHVAASGVVTAGVAWSLMLLYRIFVQGAWPTYEPHLVIGVVVAIVIAQTLWFRRR